MPTVQASSSDSKQVHLEITVHGLPMTQMEAAKFAKDARSSLCYGLGVEHDNLTVDVSADSAPPPAEGDEGKAPGEVATVGGATAEEIRARSSDEFKAARLAGRIPAVVTP